MSSTPNTNTPGSTNSGHTSQTATRLNIPPAAGWQHKSRALVSSGLFWPLFLLILVLMLLGTSSLLMLSMQNHLDKLYLAQIILLFFGVLIIGVILYRIHHQLMQPLSHLRNWAMRMSGGNLAARIPVPPKGEFAELAKDINSLGEELMTLSREMDEKVSKQTERIAQKNRSLEILYDVAASINISRDLDDLLVRFLRILNDVVKAKAATLRLLTEDDQMRLVASIGLDDEVVKQEKIVPVVRCLCGKAIEGGELLSQENVRQCGMFAGTPFFEDEDIEMIAVPLQYRGNTLGVYNLFIEKPGVVNREDVKDLLISIGRHMGMAIEKSRMDAEAKNVTIMQERNILSGELHDSLAQTLASLRFQVRMLDDSLAHGDEKTATKEVQQIRNGLDEAYSELRELIAHFRAPFDQRGLIASIENVIERFRKESGILTFFQNEWHDEKLPSVMEMQVLRIVQESLNNIRKHSQAHAVRVLLRTEADGSNMLLIEDDGVGMGEPALEGKPGEHVGLSIMQERAKRLGGNLQIESEIGEGTRVTLTFNPVEEKQQNLLDLI